MQVAEQFSAEDKSTGASTSASTSTNPWPTSGDTVHVIFTSNGSPYLNYQSRIMAGSFRLAQQMPGGEKMVAITRILHRTKPDELMDEIPTFRADPLQPKCDDWCEFPVSDRYVGCTVLVAANCCITVSFYNSM